MDEYSYYLDLVCNKWFPKVMEGLAKRDYENLERITYNMAIKEAKHRKIKDIEALQREFMTGFNYLHAVGLAKIFEKIEEGQKVCYLNLEITKQNDEIIITKLEGKGRK